MRILLDRPDPLVAPPLKIRLEHGLDMDPKAIRCLEEEMALHFREELRITPHFIWVHPETTPRETGKIKWLEVANHRKGGNR
jgi:phenylacetate-CoA ligase